MDLSTIFKQLVSTMDDPEPPRRISTTRWWISSVEALQDSEVFQRTLPRGGRPAARLRGRSKWPGWPSAYWFQLRVWYKR